MPAALVQLVVCDVDGTLTDGGIFLGARGEELKKFSVLDGLGIALLREAGIEVAFLSARSSPIVEERARELGLRWFESGASSKKEQFLSWISALSLAPREACYIGDDLNDIQCLRIAGFPVAVANARPEVKRYAEYTTRAPGGEGAVREVAELVLDARGRWKPLLERFL